MMDLTTAIVQGAMENEETKPTTARVIHQRIMEYQSVGLDLVWSEFLYKTLFENLLNEKTHSHYISGNSFNSYTFEDITKVLTILNIIWNNMRTLGRQRLR